MRRSCSDYQPIKERNYDYFHQSNPTMSKWIIKIIYFDYFARWGNFGLLGFFYELHCARIGDGSQIKTKMEIILQEDASIHRRQHEVHFSVHF